MHIKLETPFQIYCKYVIKKGSSPNRITKKRGIVDTSLFYFHIIILQISLLV